MRVTLEIKPDKAGKHCGHSYNSESRQYMGGNNVDLRRTYLALNLAGTRGTILGW